MAEKAKEVVAPSIIKYEHHGVEVSVRSDLKGKHREHCLCYGCAKFLPEAPERCKIAYALYLNCVKHKITTPVWECQEFQAI